MPRYIDADALKLDIDLSKGASVLDMAISVIKAVKEAPTADVEPRAEVAREIFGDFEASFYGDGVHYMLTQADYYELKKKYTEGKE